mmetsp:Transcript_10762/g.19924  ORF Transcript_10762/g.19924 Transcript_10762/m.19924 type:complete len:139 (+) Transcript_10762:119-535(+)
MEFESWSRNLSSMLHAPCGRSSDLLWMQHEPRGRSWEENQKSRVKIAMMLSAGVLAIAFCLVEVGNSLLADVFRIRSMLVLLTDGAVYRFGLSLGGDVYGRYKHDLSRSLLFAVSKCSKHHVNRYRDEMCLTQTIWQS